MRSSMVRFIHRSQYVVFVAALLGGLALAAALLGGLALAAPSALGDPGDENWTPFSVGLSGGDVNAMAVDSTGNLYVGGAFTTTTGGVLVTRTARFDGTTWSALGSGLEGTVRAMAFDSSGNLYAVGGFTGGVAMWNGSTWSVVGGGVTGTPDVRGLAIDGLGNVYVGGTFTSTGTCVTGCAGIAMWNGTTWSAVGGGLGGTGCRVNGLTYDSVGNNLYVAGQNACNVADPGGVNLTISRVARWNFTSSTWSALCDPGPACGLSSNANGWAVDSKGNAYVAFGGSTAGIVTNTNRIAKWDPTANAGAGGWFALCNGANCGSTAGGTGRGVVVDNADNMYFISDRTTTGGVTTNYIAKWNPNANGGLGAWSALGSGLGADTPRGLGYRDGNLYVGGGFTTLGNGSATLRIARWTAADGRAITGTGAYNFYANNMPIGVNVSTQGDLARIDIQRFNTNHPSATAQIQTGYYWQIEGLNVSGATATGFSVNLTLPASGFTPDERDRVCYYTGSAWNCAMDSYNATSITRNGVTSFSDWATGNDIGPLMFPLTVTKSGTGSGLVTSTPQGIDCGVTCTARFESGTIVTLTAQAAADSSFGSWGGACLGPGTVILPGPGQLPQCLVPMTAARDVTVAFTLNTYPLTVTKSGAGSGTVTSVPAGIDCGLTCTASFNAGTMVTLTATAAAGSSFGGWGGACSGTADCVVSMDAAKGATATFNKYFIFLPIVLKN